MFAQADVNREWFSFLDKNLVVQDKTMITLMQGSTHDRNPRVLYSIPLAAKELTKINLEVNLWSCSSKLPF